MSFIDRSRRDEPLLSHKSARWEPALSCGCEIRAHAVGVRGAVVVRIAIVVDIAEVRRRINVQFVEVTPVSSCLLSVSENGCQTAAGS